MLNRFVSDIQTLEKEGVLLDNNQRLYGTLVTVVGDNLARHQIFNMNQSFKAKHFCSTCDCDQEQLQQLFHEKFVHIRTQDEYMSALRDVERGNPEAQQFHGLKGPCALNKSYYWKLSENCCFDLLHDGMEGIVMYEIKLILNQFVHVDHLLDMDCLNEAICYFPYGKSDRSNIPCEIVNVSFVARDRNADKKLRQSGAQMWALLRLLPIMICDYIPEHNKYWTFLLQLCDLFELLCAPTWSLSDIEQFREMYQNHLICFTELFPSSSLIPKHHNLIHYPSMVLKNGPASKLWCFGFEHKGQFMKRIASSMSNFRNPQKSIAQRHQDYMFDCIRSSTTFTNCLQVQSTDTVPSVMLPVNFRAPSGDRTVIVTHLSGFGGDFLTGLSILPLSLQDNGEINFGVFIGANAVFESQESLFMLFKICRYLYYDEHTHSHVIETTDEMVVFCSVDVIDKRPLDAYNLPGSADRKRIRLRHAMLECINFFFFF